MERIGPPPHAATRSCDCPLLVVARATLLVHAAELVTEYVVGDPAAQPVALLDGMMKVHATKDARIVDFIDHIPEPNEGMRRAGHLAGDAVRDLVGVEECGQRIHEGLCDATV